MDFPRRVGSVSTDGDHLPLERLHRHPEISWGPFQVRSSTHMEVSWNGGTPSHHPFEIGISHFKPSIWGYPHLWTTPYKCQRVDAKHGASDEENTACDDCIITGTCLFVVRLRGCLEALVDFEQASWIKHIKTHLKSSKQHWTIPTYNKIWQVWLPSSHIADVFQRPVPRSVLWISPGSLLLRCWKMTTVVVKLQCTTSAASWMMRKDKKAHFLMIPCCLVRTNNPVKSSCKHEYDQFVHSWPQQREVRIPGFHIINVIPSPILPASDALSTFLENWTSSPTVLGPSRAIADSEAAHRREAASAEAWWCRCRDVCTHNSRLRSMRSKRMVGLVGTHGDIWGPRMTDSIWPTLGRDGGYFWSKNEPSRWQYKSNCLLRKASNSKFHGEFVTASAKVERPTDLPERSATKHMDLAPNRGYCKCPRRVI